MYTCYGDECDHKPLTPVTLRDALSLVVMFLGLALAFAGSFHRAVVARLPLHRDLAFSAASGRVHASRLECPMFLDI